MKKLINFLFNRWRKHKPTHIFMDEADSISEKQWKKILKVKIKAGRGEIITCGTDISKNGGIASFGYRDKKGVFHVKKLVKI